MIDSWAARAVHFLNAAANGRAGQGDGVLTILVEETVPQGHALILRARKLSATADTAAQRSQICARAGEYLGDSRGRLHQ